MPAGHHQTLTMSEAHETVHLKSKIVVLYKNLNDKQKIFCLLQFFSDVAQNSLSFPCTEKFLSISGVWSPCQTEPSYDKD